MGVRFYYWGRIDSETSQLPPIRYFKAKQNLVLISLNRCGMVGVGLGVRLKEEEKEENQIWSEKRILLYFQIIRNGDVMARSRQPGKAGRGDSDGEAPQAGGLAGSRPGPGTPGSLSLGVAGGAGPAAAVTVGRPGPGRTEPGRTGPAGPGSRRAGMQGPPGWPRPCGPGH